MPANNKNFKSQGTIATLASTVAHLFGSEKPALAHEPPLEPVLEMKQGLLGDVPVGRCLVFCPDALGAGMFNRQGKHMKALRTLTGIQVPLMSVMPPKTPVCFASMFTGGRSRDHGITRYEKPVLKCDTLFDALLRTGRKIAVVAVKDSSVDLIFRNRAMDYFSEPYDREVEGRALDVIRENRHHLVVVYQQEYDDLLHASDPFSDQAMQGMSRHIRCFRKLTEMASKAWNNHSMAFVFAPDHGGHLDAQTGHGDHGEDIPEDMEVYHWYGMTAS